MLNRLVLAVARRPGVRRFVASRALTRAVVDRFVAGDTVDDAVRAGRDLARTGLATILDYLGEHVGSEAQADTAAQTYLDILRRVEQEGIGAHVSVKLTQLGLDLSSEGALQRMEKLCAGAASAGTAVAIDMESHEYTDRTIECYRRLRATHDNVVLCLQAYLKRTPDDVASLLPLHPMIRLCKGAYDEPSEIALARAATREAYRRLLETLLPGCPSTAIATHDEALVESALRLARRLGLPPERYEFQMLFGVRRELQARLAADGSRVRVYVPFGEQWYPYLSRRLAERPANLRLFVEALLRG